MPYSCAPTPEQLRAVAPVAAAASRIVLHLAERRPTRVTARDLERMVSLVSADQIARTLAFLEAVGAVQRDAGGSCRLVGDGPAFSALGWRLAGLADAYDLDDEPEEARLVLTEPRRGSRLHRWLVTNRPDSFRTTDAFRHLACAARDRLVIASPFLDGPGGELVVELLRAAACPTRQLIIRDPAERGCSDGWQEHGPDLVALGAEVYAYQKVLATGGYETFHAKFVIADERLSYIGSANFIRTALALQSEDVCSLECGVLFAGRAVGELAGVADAMIAVGRRLI